MAGSLRTASGRSGSARRRAQARRHARVRKKVSGTPARPRLAVHRSARHIAAQVIDDTRGHTMASASTLDGGISAAEGDKSVKARMVGELVARRARDADIGAVVFDRNGYKYHGRVAALADGARGEGLTL